MLSLRRTLAGKRGSPPESRFTHFSRIKIKKKKTLGEIKGNLSNLPKGTLGGFGTHDWVAAVVRTPATQAT